MYLSPKQIKLASRLMADNWVFINLEDQVITLKKEKTIINIYPPKTKK